MDSNSVAPLKLVDEAIENSATDSKIQDMDSKIQGMDYKIQGMDSKIQGMDSKTQGMDSKTQDMDYKIQDENVSADQGKGESKCIICGKKFADVHELGLHGFTHFQ